MKTYPPANVLAALIDESLHGPECEALFSLRQHDHKAAIELLERQRLEAVAIVRPTMAMFFASLTVAGLRQPQKRDDTPTQGQIDSIQKIVNEMGLIQFPDRSAIRRVMKEQSIKIGNPTLTKIFELLRNNPLK